MDAKPPFDARCEPVRLVRPVRRRPRDAVPGEHPDRPTRHQVRRGGWRQTTYGYHVPVGIDSTVPEQRILEQSMRLEGIGAVTGWAALRLRGAAYFDGWRADGTLLPVPLVSPRQLSATEASSVSRGRIDSASLQMVQGIPCVAPEPALVDELVRATERRDNVVAVDMTIAARLTSLRRLWRHSEMLRGSRRRLLTDALALADERSRSPQESRLRLVWMIDASLPRPLCNRVVYGTDGTVLGCPDLLDVEAGVVGEYDGAAHRGRERHRRDVGREALFRDHGLECFTVVAGDTVAVQVERMHAARRRARAAVGSRRWTIEPPPGAWRPVEVDLDRELDVADWRREMLARWARE